MSELLCEFPQILHTVFCKIITGRLGFQKFCTRWVLKALAGAHKTLRMASALNFLGQYKKDGSEFFCHVMQINQVMIPGFHL
jgi:hypothetical protein